MPKPAYKYKYRNKPITTWLSCSQVERLAAIARAHGVTVATFMRAIVIDVLDDEAEGFSLYVSPTGEAYYKAHLKVKTHHPSSACVSDQT